MKILLFVTMIFLVGCSSDYRISKNLVNTIQTKEDWWNNQPEIMYLAMRGEKEIVARLFRMIPMVVKDECACGQGSPCDAAAIVIDRQLTVDPELEIFQTMDADSRKVVFDYICSLQPIDWEPEKFRKKYSIPEEERISPPPESIEKETRIPNENKSPWE